MSPHARCPQDGAHAEGHRYGQQVLTGLALGWCAKVSTTKRSLICNALCWCVEEEEEELLYSVIPRTNLQARGAVHYQHQNTLDNKKIFF